jgi:hypothetical protein
MNGFQLEGTRIKRESMQFINSFRHILLQEHTLSLSLLGENDFFPSSYMQASKLAVYVISGPPRRGVGGAYFNIINIHV